jgi:hypothetical protein
MREKKRFGIKFPNGKVEEIVFSSPSSSGVVFGLTHSSKHVTVVEERNAISSHTTEEDTKRHSHLGRVSEKEMSGELWLQVLKPRKLKDDELDQKMTYFTKKWVSVFNVPEDRFIKETDDKSMHYLDLDEFLQYIYSFIQDLQGSPDTYLGSCPVRQMLLSKDIEGGLLEKGKLVVRIDKELYEMDLSLLGEALFMQNGSVSENPENLMLNVFKTLGISFLQENLMKRFQEITKVQQDDK